jgi:hypothetical protein
MGADTSLRDAPVISEPYADTNNINTDATKRSPEPCFEQGPQIAKLVLALYNVTRNICNQFPATLK